MRRTLPPASRTPAVCRRRRVARVRQRLGCRAPRRGACSRRRHAGEGACDGRAVRLRDRGRGSAGSALGNRLSSDPSNRVLVLEAGRPDYIWDVFIHMPAASRSRSATVLRLEVRERARAAHERPARLPRAGKVLGGSSSINGMIFQRGNPLDYERWASDPGMETWDYAHCLPYFKRMERCLAADRDDGFRGHAGPLVLERGPATGRCSARSSRPCSRRDIRSPTT